MLTSTRPIPAHPVILRLGVVGFSTSKFDGVKAEGLMKTAFDRVESENPLRPIVVVSGLTNLGIPKLAYAEAKLRGWKTAGVACEKAFEFEWFPVDFIPIIVGKKWGDETAVFIKSIDLMIRIGGGVESLSDAQAFSQMGKPVYTYELPPLN